MALVNKGVALGRLDRPQEEIAACDEVVREFGGAQEPALRQQVAVALLYKGITLGQLDKPQDAVAVYDEVARRFGGAQQPALCEMVAKALWERGLAHCRLGDPREAAASFQGCLERAESLTPAQRISFARSAARDRPTLDEILTNYPVAEHPELGHVVIELAQFLGTNRG
jgi:tetratricopeptide (TPR) repeat protein